MRPVRLEVRGFTAFREPATVEFEGRRLFVITGPTGAGKSSLLDAMMWALYGQVPRVGKSIRDLIAHGEREASVLFEFTVRGRPYRVSRRVRAVSEKSTSTDVRLDRLVKDQWVPVDGGDRVTGANQFIQDTLGMDYATFTRAIVLPQGQFDAFLRGDRSERRNILSQLIGLGIYEAASSIARQRATAAKNRAEWTRAQLEQLQFASPEHVAALRKSIATLEADSQALEARRNALIALRELATEAHQRREAHETAARAAAEATSDLEAATATAKRHAKQAKDGAAAVERAEAARAALAYDAGQHDRLKAQVALLDQRASAQAALTAAQEDARAAREGLTAAGEAFARAQEAATAASTAAAVAEKAGAAASKDLGAVVGRALRARALAEESLATLERQAEAAEDAARALEQRVRDLEALAGAAEAARKEAEQAQRHAGRAAEQAQAARTAQETATRARDEAAAARDQAQAAFEHARTEDAAAAIRSGLKPGDPCPVCGEPLAKVAKRAPANLEKARRVLEQAEAALAAARQQAEQGAAQAASAATRAEETARGLEAAQARLGAYEQQAAGLGTTLQEAPAALAAARKEGAPASKAVEAARREVGTAREGLQALRDALARVPEDVQPVEAKRGAATPEEVRAALEGYRAARDAAAAASAASEEAQRALKQAERDQQAAQRDLARCEKACSEAEARLAGLGGVEGDPDAIRQALRDADALAQRVPDAAEAVRLAREALASAEASAKAATATVERERARAATRDAECEAARAALEGAQAALAEAWRGTVGAEPAPSIRALKEVMDHHAQEQNRVTGALGEARVQVAQAEAQLQQAGTMRAEVAEQQATYDLADAVARDLQGNRFIAFLLHESMQLLAGDASERLSQFTSGRYALEADEDEFMVVDRLNGDERRSVKTLSGGETFLASLALALSLSEHLPEISGTGGAVSLDSLFLDEGFGALDADALDLAVQGLETLAEGTRMVGVISHVEELAERLPDRIRVEKGVHGSTVAV